MARLASKQQIDELYQKLLIAYTRTFMKDNPFVQTVLDDLAKFCRANESTFHQDPRAHALAEGRREVWLRIQNHLNLTIDELYKINKVVQIKGDENDSSTR